MSHDQRERRRFPRIGLTLPVAAEVDFGRVSQRVSLCDISATGARISCSESVDLSLVDLTYCIALNKSQFLFRHRAQNVRRSLPTARGRVEYGLEFLYGGGGAALKKGMVNRTLMAQFCSMLLEGYERDSTRERLADARAES